MEVTIGTFKATDDIRCAVDDVLDTGRLSYGPYSRALEEEFAWTIGRKYGVLSNSGTSSLHVALLALKEQYGLGKYDTVVVPALTFVATYNAVLHAGLRPVIVDVDPVTWDIGRKNIQDAKDVFAPKIVITANLFGKPSRLLELRHYCNDRDSILIEDSCEAVGALHGGRMVGGYGDVSVFSFYMAHILTAGVGGMAITDDSGLATLMRSYVNHGLSVDNLPGQKFDSDFLGRNFVFDRIGHSFRITEIEAAIALQQLRNLFGIITKRNGVAHYYLDGLSDLIGTKIDCAHVGDNETSSWQMFPIVVKEETKHGLMDHLRKNGIECRDLVPLTNQPCYEEMFDPEEYPVAKHLNEHGLYIGCHENITDGQAGHVVMTIREYFRGK